jgi:putative intracellular protease/amidase
MKMSWGMISQQSLSSFQTGDIAMEKAKKIAIVVTSHSQIDESHPTGLWLEEVATPYIAFKTQGFEVTLASIHGGQAPIDPRSKTTEVQGKLWTEVLAALENTPAVTSLSSADYDAIFLPGGHGTMFDMPANQDLQLLLREFAESDKVIAAVCHGPAGLVGVTLSDGTPLVAQKKLTAFTNEEERATELDKLMPFLLETKLRKLGANFVSQPMWSDHIEQDGNIITGQNPQSSDSIARAVIEKIDAT